MAKNHNITFAHVQNVMLLHCCISKNHGIALFKTKNMILPWCMS